MQEPTESHTQRVKAHGSRKYAYKGLLDMRTKAWCIASNSALFISFFSCDSAFFFHNHLIQLPSSATFIAEQMFCMIAFSVAIGHLQATMKETEVQHVHDKLGIITVTWVNSSFVIWVCPVDLLTLSKWHAWLLKAYYMASVKIYTTTAYQ